MPIVRAICNQLKLSNLLRWRRVILQPSSGFLCESRQASSFNRGPSDLTHHEPAGEVTRDLTNPQKLFETVDELFDSSARFIYDYSKSHSLNHVSVIRDSKELRSVEDILFELLCDKDEKISINRFFNLLQSTGLRLNDPRLRESMHNFTSVQRQVSEFDGTDGILVDRETFRECVSDNVVLIGRAFRNQFVIPEFSKFTNQLDQIYWKCRTNTTGKVADYIPQLARFSPDYWGVSVCTIDGQRHSIGDANIHFCLQSVSKPLNYALALSDLGSEVVHQYVGQEPSGGSFNELSLNTSSRPHNPMINSGAIVISSLLKNQLKLADRFDYILGMYRRLAGGEFLGFSNATFLSERETADRNFALGYYMKENKCFPEGANLLETLDFYFQLCSIEATGESASVMAATLANGGICPITGDRVLDADSVRNTLSLMHSCGMYDYSGQFAFQVGLPGKSGVSGAIMLVVPNVFGMCMWSPPLDATGNSCRGIQMCQELVNTYNFHNYDNLKYATQKTDPRRRRIDNKAQDIVNLLFGAFNGDVSAIRRYALSGMDMRQSDYDGRTALHLAAAEGHAEVVTFLLEKCDVPLTPKDRWGFTPMCDAKRFGHDSVVEILNNHEHKLSDLEQQKIDDDKQCNVANSDDSTISSDDYAPSTNDKSDLEPHKD
ncbi:glutaminase liver isoform, mitochondrial-like [Tubulanus polymorphus]|uniref:glutaminase liver isoform, mitochondrial-like n=1 Tax=Tubulanus polymorphus TaxID=672921 RepID=UPI003DA431F2